VTTAETRDLFQSVGDELEAAIAAGLEGVNIRVVNGNGKILDLPLYQEFLVKSLGAVRDLLTENDRLFFRMGLLQRELRKANEQPLDEDD
jgi:hypothetical protein